MNTGVGCQERRKVTINFKEALGVTERNNGVSDQNGVVSTQPLSSACLFTITSPCEVATIAIPISQMAETEA